MHRLRLGAAAIAVLLITIIALGTALAIGVEDRPQPYVANGPGDIYLALGDSLAWGFSLDDRATQSYPALLSQRLGVPVELQNIAVPGATSTSMLRRQIPLAVELLDTARAEGLRVSPITVGIGGNDLRNVERAGPQERAATVELVASNLAQSLDQLRAAAGEDADIAVMTYYNPYGGDPQDPASEAYWVEQLNAAIAAVAEEQGVALANVYDRFGAGRAYTHTFILLGDLHANAAGHELMADAFYEALGY